MILQDANLLFSLSKTNVLIKLIQQNNEKELKQSLELFTKMRDKNKITGLMLVSAYNRINLVKYFKNQITQQSSNGRTALMYAAEHDNADMINYLIKEGNMQDTFGFSALMLCVIRDSRQFAQHLMKHNVDLCKRLKRDYGFYQADMNALLIAALHENMFFVKLLMPFEVCQVDIKQIDYVYFLTKNLNIAQMLYSEIQKKKQQSPGQSRGLYNPPSVTAQFKIYLGVFTEIDIEKIKIIHFSEPAQEELIKNQKIELEQETELIQPNPDNVSIVQNEQKVQIDHEQKYNKQQQSQEHQNTINNTEQQLQMQEEDEEDSWGEQPKLDVQSPVITNTQSVTTPSSLDDQREKMRRLMLFRFSNAKNYLAESSESTTTGENYKLSQSTDTRRQLSHSDGYQEKLLNRSQLTDSPLKQSNTINTSQAETEKVSLNHSLNQLSSQYIDVQLQNSIQDSSRLITSNTEANYIFLKSSEDIQKALDLKNKYEHQELIEEINDVVKDLDNIQNELSMSSHLSQIVKNSEGMISQLQNKNTNLQEIIQQQIQQMIEKDQIINDLKLENQNMKNNFQRNNQIIEQQLSNLLEQQRQQQKTQVAFYGIFFVIFNAYIVILSYFIQHNQIITQMFNKVFYKK